MNLASYIDHTLLKPEAKLADVERLCKEALEYKFAAVCINPLYVSAAKKLLDKSGIKVATVIGFPLGANTTSIKVAETLDAIANGADEIDMVLSIGVFKASDYKAAGADIALVVKAAANKPVKVIIETGLLTPDEIVKASELCIAKGAAFVKTSTGFGPRGASIEDINLIKKTISNKGQIKASGGIKTADFAKALIEAGATRLGCSASVAIMKESKGV